MLKTWLTSLLALLLLSCAYGAWDPNAEYEKKQKAIQQEFSNAFPDLAETFHTGQQAYAAQDYAGAERHFRDLVDRAPESDIAQRRWGASLMRLGKRKEGLVALDRALALNRSAENLATLGYFLTQGMYKNEVRRDFDRGISYLEEAIRLPQGNEDENHLYLCQALLTSNKNSEFFEAATRYLRAFPASPLSHYMYAIRAAANEEWLLAEDEANESLALGMPKEAVSKFLDAGVHSNALPWRLAKYFGIVVLSWLGGLALLFGLGFLLSKITLSQAYRTENEGRITSNERRLRSLYRTLINIAGIYYYVSLPIVVLMVFGVVILLAFLIYVAGFIAIKLILLGGLGAIVTVAALVRSLFVKIDSKEPGRSLKREEAPGLWQLAEEVAADVGTRPIDEIRLTPGTDVFVYERGSRRERWNNQAHRVLTLGVGVIKDFPLDAFRAVLAHEYGHFNNRDTAGGDIALRVQKDMLQFYYAMYSAGQATATNIAFHFLRFYNFLFRRVSHGATRLQEILADRVAATLYGNAAFEAGLLHVIRASLIFHKQSDVEIKQALDKQLALQNLYQLSTLSSDDIEKDFKATVERPTTDDDTHPSPKDRFALISKFAQSTRPSRPGFLWDLFADRVALESEMMETVENLIKSDRGSEDPLRKKSDKS